MLKGGAGKWISPVSGGLVLGLAHPTLCLTWREGVWFNPPLRCFDATRVMIADGLRRIGTWIGATQSLAWSCDSLQSDQGLIEFWPAAEWCHGNEVAWQRCQGLLGPSTAGMQHCWNTTLLGPALLPSNTAGMQYPGLIFWGTNRPYTSAIARFPKVTLDINRHGLAILREERWKGGKEWHGQK